MTHHSHHRPPGELREYVAEEVNVRLLTPCADPLQYATLRGEPEFQVGLRDIIFLEFFYSLCNLSLVLDNNCVPEALKKTPIWGGSGRARPAPAGNTTHSSMGR